jgi:transmembrane E3 ubiquitin-protein ligase
MPLPDPESPEQSLGDCAICMDAIVLDASSHRRSKSNDDWRDHGIVSAGGGLLNAVQMGVGVSGARKNYSLAPCHHLFVSCI